MSVSAVSDPVARRRQLAAWYLLFGHRVLWMLPLTAALVIFGATMILRGTSADPRANLKESRAEFMALAPEKIPDEENAAKVYERAFAALVPDKAPGKTTLGNAHHYIGVPFPPPPEVTAYLRANAGALDELAAAAKLPRCNFGGDYSQGAGMLMPHLSKARACARLLGLRARELAHAGEHEKAAEAIRQMFALADALESDPLMISTLVGLAIRGITLGTVQAIVRWDTPSDDKHLAAYMSVLQHREWRPIFVRALHAEQKYGLYEMDRIAAHAINPASIPGAPPEAALIAPMYGAERQCFERSVSEILELLTTAEWPQLKQWDDNEDTEIRKIVRKHQTGSAVLTRLVLPAFGRIAQSLTRGENQITLARTALAFLRYRARHGRDPQTIGELAPDFLPAEPVDACEQTTLKFRRDEDGETLLDPATKQKTHVSEPVIRLYTFAENGKDDNGYNADWLEAFDPKAAQGSDDIFFRIPLLKTK